MNRVKIELAGSKIGCDGSLASLIARKEASIQLIVYDDDHTFQHRYVVCKQDILDLFISYQEQEAALPNGFKIV